MHYLTAAEVAKLLRKSTGTLRNWRSQGIGPAWCRMSESVNAPVLYPANELQAWIKRNESRSN